MDLNPHTAEQIVANTSVLRRPLLDWAGALAATCTYRPDGRAAVKVHRGEEGFTREVEAYQRLRRFRISQVHNITIPKVCRPSGARTARWIAADGSGKVNT